MAVPKLLKRQSCYPPKERHQRAKIGISCAFFTDSENYRVERVSMESFDYLSGGEEGTRALTPIMCATTLHTYMNINEVMGKCSL